MKYDGYQVGIVIKSLRIQRNLTKEVQAAGGIIVTVDDGRLAMQLRGF